MRKFKIIDYWISIILIITFTIIRIYAVEDKFEKLILGYFVVGGWQVISMIIHAVKKWFTHKWSSRYIYHFITLVSVITMPAGSIWILAFTAPFMAIYYTYMCYHEVTVKMQRPLALLK